MPIKEETETYGRKHPVPQNVMDVEFKVVGDLTVRQVMYLFGGGILTYVAFKSGLPAFWKWTFTIFSALLTLGVAFVPIQERGMDKWVISFVRAITAPSQRVWRKTYSPPSYFLADYASIIRNEIITLTPAKSRNKLNEFLGQIDNGKTQYDSDEDERLKSIQYLYSTPAVSPTLVEPTVPRKPTSAISNTNQEPQFDDIKESEQESKEEFMEAFDSNRRRIRLEQIDRTMYNLPSKMKGEIDIRTRHRLPATIIEESLEELQKREKDLEKKMQEFLVLVEKAKREFSKHTKPGAQEENKENRLRFLNEKLEQLHKEKDSLQSIIDKSEEQAKNISEEKPKAEFSMEMEKVHKRNKFLEDELKKVKLQFDTMTMGSQRYTATGNKEARKPVLEDKEESRFIPKAVPKPLNPAEPEPLEPEVPVSIKQVSSGIKAQQKKPDDTTELPNIVHGVVKDKSGVLLEDAVIMVKDEKGDVVRALKTNKLGQFKTQTSVNNGKYTIEAIKGGENFDIISIVARGEPLPSLTLIGKK